MNYLYFLAFWLACGLLTFIIHLIELKVKKLGIIKRHTFRVFYWALGLGVIGLIVSIYTLIKDVLKK